MTEQPDAALLADLANLRLQEGDAQGAEALFRQALEAQQQQPQEGEEVEAAEEDSWEDWDESTVPGPIPTPALPPAATAAAAGSATFDDFPAGPAAPGRGARPAGATRPLAAASRAPAEGGGELPFGGGHVLEFFGLTPAVKTQHLEQHLQRLEGGGGGGVPPTLKWVDDCHAAVVCSDPAAARRLLAAAAAQRDPQLALRGYADAGSGTWRLPPSELQPPRPRPKTTAAVAARLIGGALNMRLRDKDGEQQLAAERRQQRVARQQRQQGLDAAWDG